MKEFTVTMPFAGAITVVVEAENEEQAEQNFYEKVDSVCLFDPVACDKISADVDWDFYPKMQDGNVRHYQYAEIEIRYNGEIE